MITGSQATAVYSVLRNDFQKGIDEVQPIGSALFEKVTSAGRNNIYDWFDHLPGFKRWYKGQPRVMRNVKERNFTVPNNKFEDTIDIFQEDIDDKQLPSIRPRIQNMGKIGALLEDELIFNLFNYGFATTDGNGDSVAAYDDLAWFSDSHVVGETTIDNKMTAALSAANYGTAYETLMGYTAKADKMSQPRPLNQGGFKPMLIVPPALFSTAKAIVDAERNTDGSSNIWYKTAEILVAPYISTATYWFLVNIGGLSKPIFFQDREPLKIEEKMPGNDSDAFMYDKLIIGAKRRCNALVTYPWLAIGSTGGA